MSLDRLEWTTMVDVVIMAAGCGSRMQSSIPKVLHKIAGLPIIDHVMMAVGSIIPSNVIVVISEAIAHHHFGNAKAIIQNVQDGTAGAVRLAIPYLTSENVVVVCGDSPLLDTQHLGELLASNADAAIIATELPPHLRHMPYGRVITEDGKFLRIVELRDASELEVACDLINTGVYKFKTSLLKELIHKVAKSKTTGEYHLPDVLETAQLLGKVVDVVVSSDYESFHGVNTMSDLAFAESIMQRRMRNKHMEAGVKMLDPQSTFLSHDTKIASGVVVEQNVVIGTGVKIMDRAIIKSFSYLEDCEVGEGVHVGPFARIRGESKLQNGSAIGNFVEVKGSIIGANAKAKHLAYLGDALIGRHTNIGAGTVICNYDGVNKHTTNIGDDVFVGSNTTLVAPLDIGTRSILAAGSTITASVAPDSLAIARSAQDTIRDGAKRVWAKKGRSHHRNTDF
ncbi:MAG: bifunctional UDP-N-acetylglucosamine diphosphorylase/glucosamine-1-phosphate N-acetyltransferase GlmU [Holosporales bacterium]|jgi:bifunctional UDP-N-acetylglucosamine pyrophosphorylase/glucosamine-1-phosphate N-acetyltransferase|nr:bifunctional UDP-N-acetylglucosamine diphosphorylase/glucosamine-1-phosphate N-acetyltransferase GlmU [Holosporales bacterium]